MIYFRPDLKINFKKLYVSILDREAIDIRKIHGLATFTLSSPSDFELAGNKHCPT